MSGDIFATCGNAEAESAGVLNSMAFTTKQKGEETTKLQCVQPSHRLIKCLLLYRFLCKLRVYVLLELADCFIDQRAAAADGGGTSRHKLLR